MTHCPNCDIEIPEKKVRKELRRCKTCDEPIGCIHCRTPGTLAFRYCALHDPRGPLKDDGLFNPSRKKVREIHDASSSRSDEINKLIGVFKEENKKLGKFDIKDRYDELERVLKPASDRLIEIGKPAVPKVIRLLIDEKKSWISHIAAYILGEIGDERAVKPLCDTLYADDDLSLKAADALMKFGESAMPFLTKMMYSLGASSCVNASYALSGIESEKSIDALIKGMEYRVRMSDWEFVNPIFLSIRGYSNNFNDKRALNYVKNIEKLQEKWLKLKNKHHDWLMYLPPNTETFYDVLGVDENGLLGDDKEIRLFLRGKYRGLERTPTVNLAYDTLKKPGLRWGYSWMLIHHEWMNELFEFLVGRREEEMGEIVEMEDMDPDMLFELFMSALKEMRKKKKSKFFW
ncbi:MAG: hypothetical protein A7315_12930 [Candidatus Altiarchaeales archaeon WOR_SM1_79]|nr:MAG: hypothetical protein A7315_12930 [Candidatus Altiarchaeales archaeon WOR_SM1_79]